MNSIIIVDTKVAEKCTVRCATRKVPFAMRSVVAFGHKCSLLSDEPAKTPMGLPVCQGKILRGRRTRKGANLCASCHNVPRLNGGTPLLVDHVCIHIWTVTLPSVPAGWLRISSGS